MHERQAPSPTIPHTAGPCASCICSALVLHALFCPLLSPPQPTLPALFSLLQVVTASSARCFRRLRPPPLRGLDDQGSRGLHASGAERGQETSTYGLVSFLSCARAPAPALPGEPGPYPKHPPRAEHGLRARDTRSHTLASVLVAARFRLLIHIASHGRLLLDFCAYARHSKNLVKAASARARGCAAARLASPGGGATRVHVSQARMSDRPLRGQMAGKVGCESGQRV